MTISGFFEHRLGAPLRNKRWSWGAISPSGHVYLRVWADEFKTMVDGQRYVCILDPAWRGSARQGYAERHDHVQQIRAGAKAFGVILTAVDPEVDPRSIESFDADEIMVGGRVVDDDNGVSWLVDAGRRPAPGARP